MRDQWDLKRAEDVEPGDLIRLAQSTLDWVVINSEEAPGGNVALSLESASSGVKYATRLSAKTRVEYETQPYSFRDDEPINYDK